LRGDSPIDVFGSVKSLEWKVANKETPNSKHHDKIKKTSASRGELFKDFVGPLKMAILRCHFLCIYQVNTDKFRALPNTHSEVLSERTPYQDPSPIPSSKTIRLFFPIAGLPAR